MSLYRSGMAKAHRRDFQGAIHDYSLAIELAELSADVKAMVLYNRALAYSAIRQEEHSLDDLAELLKIPGVPANVRTEAEQRRQRLQRRGDRQ